MTSKILAAVTATLTAVAAGCTDASTERHDSILLYCGAGLRPPMAEIVDAFSSREGTAVATDFAGSEVLLSRIRLARRGDLYLPGDRRYVDLAAGEGLVAARAPIATFVPVILVARGNPKSVEGVRDILRSDVRVGLGNPRACAIGRVSREIVEKNGLAWDDVESRVVFLSATVNELGLQIEAGALDLVIVWDALARYWAKSAEAVRIPLVKNVVSTVDAAILTFTKNRQVAERFLRFLASERGRGVLEKYGYSTGGPKSTTGEAPR